MKLDMTGAIDLLSAMGYDVQILKRERGELLQLREEREKIKCLVARHERYKDTGNGYIEELQELMNG